MATRVRPLASTLLLVGVLAAALWGAAAAQGLGMVAEPPEFPVALTFEAPSEVLADREGRFELSVAVVSDLESLQPLELSVASSVGLELEGAARLRGVLGLGAQPQLRLRGRLTGEVGTLELLAEPFGARHRVEVRRVADAEVSSAVRQPTLVVIDDPDWRVAIDPASSGPWLPGASFELRATIERRAASASAYAWRWLLPEWLIPEGPLELDGVIAAGGEEERTLAVRVAAGGTAAGVIALLASNRLESTGGALEALAAAEVQRSPLGLLWVEAPRRGWVGEPLQLEVRVENPTATALSVEPHLVAYGLTRPVGAVESGAWLLQPGANRLRLAVLPLEVGAAVAELTLRADGVLVSERLLLDLDVAQAPQPLRRTTLAVRLELEAGLDAIVIRQAPPAGAVLIPESVLLNGSRFEAPRVAADGAWWWRIVAPSERLDLTFELAHGAPLAEVLPAEVTARRGLRDLPLLGDLRSSGWPSERVAVVGLHEPEPVADSAGWRLLAPAAGAVFRVEDAVEITLAGPRAESFELLLNGEPLPSELVGRLSDDLETGRSELSFVAVPWRAGENLLVLRSAGETLERRLYLAARPARLRVEPLHLELGSTEPWLIRVEVLDEEGHPVGFGPLDVRSERPFVGADAFPEIPGWQTLLRDGEALIELQPGNDPLPWDVEVAFGALRIRERLSPTLPTQSLSHAQGSIALRFGSEVRFDARGALYLEQSGDGAALQLALGGELGWSPTLGWRLNPATEPARSDRFSVTGVTGGEEQLRSDDGFAFRLRAPTYLAAYERGPIRLPALRGELFGSALRAAFEPDPATRIEGFAAWVAPSQIEQRIDPDGRRRYLLDAAPTPGSLRVLRRVEQSDGFVLEERPLIEGVDYAIESDGPALLLSRAAFGTTLEGDRVSLHLSYQSADAPRTRFVTGAALSVASDPWSVRAALASLPAAGGVANALTGALELGFRQGIWSAQGRLAREGGASPSAEFGVAMSALEWGDLRASGRLTGELGARARLDATLTLDARSLPLSFDGALALRSGRAATAQVGALWRATPDLSLSLRASELPQSPLLALAVRQRLAPLDLEGALRYRLQEGDLQATLAASAEGANLRWRLEQSATLSGLEGAVTRAEASWDLFGVRWVGALGHTWGETTRGSLAVEQRLADATLRAEVELPTAARPAHARFSVATPWRVNDRLSLDALLGSERDLASGAQRTSVALTARLTERQWEATLSGEARFALATELLLYGDAEGRWGARDQHRFSVQSRLQFLPSLAGHLHLAQASFGDRLTFLGYQRLTLAEFVDLEGEFALHWQHPWSGSLRPALAFRYRGADPEAFAVQGAIGATLYRVGRVSVGGALYQALQPRLDLWSTAVGVEVSLELVGEVALVIGATVGEGPGLVAGGSPGMHLRLDAFGGTR